MHHPLIKEDTQIGLELLNVDKQMISFQSNPNVLDSSAPLFRKMHSLCWPCVAVSALDTR